LTVVQIDQANPALTGGSPILSYSIEVDDGQGGSLVPLYGNGTDSMSTSYIVSVPDMSGRVFRSRYRVRNAVGWSQYSPMGYTRAASVPSAPPAPPRFVSATDTTMTVAFTHSLDNGGSNVVNHELWVDGGGLGPFQKVTRYDGASLSFTLDTA
jgi:hypothetical protein